MNIQDLAKELDTFARALRSSSSEAAALIASALQLEQRRNGLDGGGRCRPKKLTLHAISNAIAAAQRAAGPRARDLRKDVFERRVEKFSSLYASRLETMIRAGQPCPSGERVSGTFSSRGSSGSRAYFDVVGMFDRSAIAAELAAWGRAATYVVARLVPAYQREAMERAARSHTTPGRDAWRIADAWRDALAAWVEANTVFLCELTPQGKATRVNGLCTEPFAELLTKVRAGNADPLGILRAPPLNR